MKRDIVSCQLERYLIHRVSMFDYRIYPPLKYSLSNEHTLPLMGALSKISDHAQGENPIFDTDCPCYVRMCFRRGEVPKINKDMYGRYSHHIYQVSTYKYSCIRVSAACFPSRFHFDGVCVQGVCPVARSGVSCLRQCSGVGRLPSCRTSTCTQRCPDVHNDDSRVSMNGRERIYTADESQNANTLAGARLETLTESK